MDATMTDGQMIHVKYFLTSTKYLHTYCLHLEIVSQGCVTTISEILFSPAFSTDREEARRYRWYFHRFAPYRVYMQGQTLEAR